MPPLAPPEPMDIAYAVRILRSHITQWYEHVKMKELHVHFAGLFSPAVLLPDGQKPQGSIAQLRTKLARVNVVDRYDNLAKLATAPEVPSKEFTAEFARNYAVTGKQMETILSEGRKLLCLCDQDYARRGLLALGVEERTPSWASSGNLVEPRARELEEIAKRFVEKVEGDEEFVLDLAVLDKIRDAAVGPGTA